MEHCVTSPKLASETRVTLDSFEESDAQRKRYTQLFARATHLSFQILRGALKQGQGLSTNHKYTCDKWLITRYDDGGIINHADDQLTYNRFVVLDC